MTASLVLRCSPFDQASHSGLPHVYVSSLPSGANTFAAGLKKNGLLVIDYLNYENVLSNLVAEETAQRGSYTFHINRRLERNHIIKEINFTDPDKQPHQYIESVAAFSLADFIKIFKPADMSLVGTFGDYQLGAYHPIDSPRLIMIFKKKHG